MVLDSNNNELPPASSYSPGHRAVAEQSGNVCVEQRSPSQGNWKGFLNREKKSTLSLPSIPTSLSHKD